MRWMKFIDHEGDTVWLNMALAESFYEAGEGTRIVFGPGREWTVNAPPDKIVERGQWEVR